MKLFSNATSTWMAMNSSVSRVTKRCSRRPGWPPRSSRGWRPRALLPVVRDPRPGAAAPPRTRPGHQQARQALALEKVGARSRPEDERGLGGDLGLRAGSRRDGDRPQPGLRRPCVARVEQVMALDLALAPAVPADPRGRQRSMGERDRDGGAWALDGDRPAVATRREAVDAQVPRR